MFLIVDWLGSGCFGHSVRHALKRLFMSAYLKKIIDQKHSFFDYVFKFYP